MTADSVDSGPPDRPGWRLAVDTGGTFTDVVIMDDTGAIAVHKILSSPENYSLSIVAGIRRLLLDHNVTPSSVTQFVHGTTVATNCILERTGARTALITTRGFRDVLEIRRLAMPRLYDLNYAKPAPLVPRELRFEVDERIDHRGVIVQELDEDSVASVCRRLDEAGVESIAVALLHSYANPTHEQRIQEILRVSEKWQICTSSSVLPQIEEYRRTSTATVNAYIKPKVSEYLRSLKTELAELGIRPRVLVMQSNGGVMTSESAIDRPVMIVESGPAAGVVAGQRLGRLLGMPNMITFDMGGTTAKAALVEDGAFTQSSEYEAGAGVNSSSLLDLGRGYLIGAPAIAIAEVGAGGGSIAWIDSGGVMQVGPASAGASPGPICYGNGGEDPTVTDANMILGYLNPANLAGGGVTVDFEKCRRLFGARLARPLGLSVEDAALGVHRIANINMQRAIRAVTIERGRNPTQFALLAFGGSGPVHGATLADQLHIHEVLVPPAAGLFSALGLLFADLTHHLTRTYFRNVGRLDWGELASVTDELQRQAGELLASDRERGQFATVAVVGDVRYLGQTYELPVLVTDPDGGLVTRQRLIDDFTSEYHNRYGHYLPDSEIEIVNLRAVATSANPKRTGWPRFSSASVPGSTRVCCFPNLGPTSTQVTGRDALAEHPIAGPLIIEEYDSTTVVPPNWSVRRDAYGNIRLDRH